MACVCASLVDGTTLEAEITTLLPRVMAIIIAFTQLGHQVIVRAASKRSTSLRRESFILVGERAWARSHRQLVVSLPLVTDIVVASKNNVVRVVHSRLIHI